MVGLNSEVRLIKVDMSGHVRLFDPCIALGLKLSTYAEWGLKGFGVGTVWAIWKIIGCLQTQRDH